MFSSQSDNCTPFVNIFDIIFLFAAELEEPKIGISGKGLRKLSTIFIKFEIVVCKLFEFPRVWNLCVAKGLKLIWIVW